MKIKSVLLRLLSLAGIGLALISCAPGNAVFDGLQYNSVQTIDTNGNADFSDMKLPSHKMLKINFTSKTDPLDFARDYHATIFGLLFYCDDKKVIGDSDVSPVFKSSLNLKIASIEMQDAKNNPPLISLYIYTAPEMLSKDKSLAQSDVCLYLEFPRDFEKIFYSNTIRIPKEAINEALKRD